jgi:hypothetical protein
MFKKLLLIASLSVSTALMAQSASSVNVEGAWIRATVAGQQGTGGFMKLTAKEDLRLVGVSSPAAGVGEVHEMKMSANNIMEMRPVTGIDLPKGKAVELKPGGYHVMLMSLKQTLPTGSKVPLTLIFKNAKGQESKLDLNVDVALQPNTSKASEAMHKN